MARFLKSLNVRLILPIICLWAIIFFFLFLFVLSPISGFVDNYIQENLQWIANSIYSICDDNLDGLIRSGKANNPRYLAIQKVRTLRHVEGFVAKNDILGFVYLSSNQIVIWENQLPVSAATIIPQALEYNLTFHVELAGKRYSGYHFSFDPWHWHIVLLKKTSHYASFINKVKKAYFITFCILLISFALILLLFNRIIKTPISQIIAPLKKGQKPHYRGIVEFEFLSKNMEHLLESLHGAKHDLENRVAERTDELRLANEALILAKEELSQYTKELEKQVAKKTSEITSILKYTPAVVYMKDTAGKYLLVNSRYEELFNVKNQDVRGKSDEDLLPKAMAEQFRINDERVLSEGRALMVEEQICQDDGVHTYYAVKFPIFADSKKITGVCGIASDITDGKKAHEQLRRLSGSIMANQEKERKAIARELHDELAQALTALRMDAFWIQDQLKKAGLHGVDRAAAMRSLIDRTLKNVQNLAVRLRPGVLDDMGLVEALDWYIGEYQKRSQINCIFNYDDIPFTDEVLATAAYRVTQEALTNVIRHAAATRVEVNLRMENERLLLTIRDNGRGFQKGASSETEELGLAGMRERAALVGGSLSVDSEPGKGTLVSFKLLLANRYPI